MIESQPLISVLIPVYNCEKYIEQCLMSILNQTYTNLQILVCDDGSTDNTVDIIRKSKDNRIELLINDTNQGNIKTVNRLISVANGAYIALQDADDWSSADRLEKQYNFLIKNNHIEACYTQMFRVNEKGNKLYETNYPLTHAAITSKFPYHFHIACPSILITKKAQELIGGYPSYFNETGGADWYWAYRISEQINIANLPEALYFYRINPDSITQERTSNYKKFFISKLIIFLVKQRKKHGNDGLEDGQLKVELELYEQKLKNRFENDPIIQEKRMYVNARLSGDKQNSSDVFKSMWSKSKWHTVRWFLTKPFSILMNKIRIYLT